MKNIYKILIIILITAGSAFSQNDVVYYINYGPSIPLSKTKDYVDKMSWRGFGFGFNKFVNNKLSLGLDISWSTYNNQIKNETFYFDNITVTGTQNKYINTVPVHATVIKYIGEEKRRYTVGLGVGTSWTEKVTDIGVYSFTDSQWQFSFAPEIGIIYNVTSNIAPYFKLKYFHSVKKSDFDNVSHLNFTLGFALK
jgi:outer membrane protein